jgi:hypothetical protein
VIVTAGGHGMINEVSDFGLLFQVDSVEQQDGTYFILGTISQSWSAHYRLPEDLADRVAIIADSVTGEIRVFIGVVWIDEEGGIAAWGSFDTVGRVR